MHRQLLLLRHAKSAWDTDASNDFERPLAKRGRKAAPRIGRWIKSHELTPESIISSPAERARQTTLAVAQTLGLDTEVIRWEPDVYAASAGMLLQVLASCPDSLERVMLIGHNPGLEDLLVLLCGAATPAPSHGKLLPTAALAVLALGCPWSDISPNDAALVDLVRPREL